MELWRELGLDVERERMQYLKEYWVQRLTAHQFIEIVTNTGAADSCGSAFFEVRGKSAAVLTKQLKDEHRIVTTAIEDYKNQYVDYAGVNAVGIATSVVNTLAELDRFCSAVEAIAR